MLKNTQQRLFLSHILPILITTSLAGLALLYVIDGQTSHIIQVGNITGDTVLNLYAHLRFLTVTIVTGEWILGAFLSWILVREMKSLPGKSTKKTHPSPEGQPFGPSTEESTRQIHSSLGSRNQISMQTTPLKKLHRQISENRQHKLRFTTDSDSGKEITSSAGSSV